MRPQAGIVAPGLGHNLPGGSTQPTVKVSPRSGSRLIGMLESQVPPGAGFPPHVHDDYEEVFYVLAGELEYLIDGTWTQAPAGSTIFVPPGHVHAWRNTTDQPARQLAITGPAEGMIMIEDAVRAAPEELGAALDRYRSHLVDEQLPSKTR
jgi:quercetin dioxygenase-like cupin family protein